MYNTMKTDYECATIIEDSESSDEEYILMPKKEKKIVRLEIIDIFEKQNKRGW